MVARFNLSKNIILVIQTFISIFNKWREKMHN
jgi:hypothetical protein